MVETPGSLIAPGFADYVVSSQRVFRIALAGLSQPCRPLECQDFGLDEAPLPQVAAALALTLLDSTTPVWLSPSWRLAESWLRFHRGCPIVTGPEKSAFILAACPAELPPLASLNQGTDRYPDSSATIILGSVLPLDGHDPLLAKGPGIDGSIVFQGHGLPPDFIGQWRNNRDSYPLGVDVFLTGGRHLAGLPRGVGFYGAGTKGEQPCM